MLTDDDIDNLMRQQPAVVGLMAGPDVLTAKQFREHLRLIARAVEAKVREQMAERKPLTEATIRGEFARRQADENESMLMDYHDFYEGVRFAEHRHGITQQGADE